MSSPKAASPTHPGTAGDPLYPIRTVSTLTGVNPITLRAWERRYGLVTPKRTAGGQRVYTRKDIDRIHRILSMIENGAAIGRVNDALSEGGSARPRVPKKDAWTEFRARMTAAISQFDEDRLEDVYNELLSLYPLERVTCEVLVPLLVELGERWSGRTGGVAEEHFFAVYLRNKLGARFHHRRRTAAGPRLLAACLPGEHHEAGLLLFALAAHEHGFRVVLFGADMPLAELGYAARSSKADAIVLSSSIEPEAKRLDVELPMLVLEAGVPVLVGGLTSVRERDAIVAAGAVPLGTDIGAGLRHLRDTLAASAR